MDKVSFPKLELHPKGWGREDWVINCPDYCMKFLRFNAGMKGSMHFHVKKHETWYIQTGKITLTTINTSSAEKSTVVLGVGDVVDIPRLNPHQVEAIEDAVIIEISTQHFDDDSYRVAPGDSQPK